MPQTQREDLEFAAPTEKSKYLKPSANYWTLLRDDPRQAQKKTPTHLWENPARGGCVTACNSRNKNENRKAKSEDTPNRAPVTAALKKLSQKSTSLAEPPVNRHNNTAYHIETSCPLEKTRDYQTASILSGKQAELCLSDHYAV